MPEVEEFMDAGDTIVVRDSGWDGGKIAVNGEAERSANGGDAANNEVDPYPSCIQNFRQSSRNDLTKLILFGCKRTVSHRKLSLRE